VKNTFWARMKATRSYRRTCGVLFRQAMPVGWLAGPVEIDMEYRCSKGAVGYVARDLQNVIAAMKAGIDALVDAGIAPNDSKKYLAWGHVSLITTKSAKADGVTITVRRQV
jgi:Holliday junction resolvase RusA-like endonuclease